MNLIVPHKENKILAEVQVAKSFFDRSRGLMFCKSWPKDKTLWIHRCNSIHTGFMNFAIDAIFVDRQLRIAKLVKDLHPWKLVLPIWSSSSVFEFVSGHGKLDGLEVGDQLYVGH